MVKKNDSQLPKLPFPVGDRAAFIRKAAVAIKIVQVPTAEVVTYSVPYNRVEVAYVPVSQIALDANTRGQYYLDGEHLGFGPSGLAKTHLSWLRSQALECGATPDAIRLLAGATQPFTKKEEANMAEKLKSKAAPKKADTKALKSAAKAAPVGGKTAPKPKGNADALARARAAKSTGPDTRKIKGLVKAKDLAARAGTFRRTMLEDLLASKTVQEWREKNPKYDLSCLKYATENNIVSVS